MKRLTWKVDVTVPASCPDDGPDQYTGEWSVVSCAVYHCKTETRDMMKEFETEEQALEFQKNAPSNCHDFALS